MAIYSAEAAALSLYVYRDQDQPPLPEGYEILIFCPEELKNVNYFGVAFITEIAKNAYRIVVSHRGTILSPSVLVDDILFYLNIVPECLELSALPFCDLALKAAKQKYPNGHFAINHTGHSLGAIIASLCCLSKISRKEQRFDSAEVFECPGTGTLVKSLLEKGRLKPESVEIGKDFITVHNADVNAINTCKEQYGYVLNPHRVGFSYSKPGDEKNIPGMPDQAYYLLQYTADQHKMIKLYKYYNKQHLTNFTQEELKEFTIDGAKWPIGFDAGFKYWTDLTDNSLDNYLQRDYWRGYTQALWDARPDIHERYDNSELIFQKWFFKQYLKEAEQLEQLPLASFHQFFKPTHYKQFITAIEKNDRNVISQLIEQSFNPDYCKDWQKRTLLHIAVMHGDLAIIRTLLENNFNSETQDILGNTAFHIAALHHDGEKLLAISKLLAEFKANPDKQNLAGMTPYDILKNKQAHSSQTFFELTNDNFVLIDKNEGIEADMAAEQESYRCSIM